MAKDPSPASKDEEQLEKLLKARQEALQEELAKVGEAKLVSKGKKVVEASWRDKLPAEQATFTLKDEKSAGNSKGYVGTETATDKTFMIKQFFKAEKDASEDPVEREKDLMNRRDGVQEFIAATMYERLLYDRAPKEQLVTPDEANTSSLYVRSKFFDDVEQLSVFSGSKKEGELDPSEKLLEIEGFEKVIAACQLLGEADYHAGNIMVQKGKGNGGEDTYRATKIDHGKSFFQFSKDFESMVTSTYRTFETFGYNTVIEVGKLVFDVKKYSESLNQMLSQFSEDQIDAIVDQRVAELKAAGFNPAGLSVESVFSKENEISQIPINDFDELATTYKDITKENLRSMREIAKQVEIVAKFSNVSEEFKKGGWLTAFAESAEKDPIKYAIANKIKIDGKDPIKYAIANKIKIDGLEPKLYVLVEKRKEYEKALKANNNGKLTDIQKERIKKAAVYGLGIGGVIAYVAITLSNKLTKVVLEKKMERVKAKIEKLVPEEQVVVPPQKTTPPHTMSTKLQHEAELIGSSSRHSSTHRISAPPAPDRLRRSSSRNTDSSMSH